MDFLGLVTVFREHGLNNVEIFAKCGFAPNGDPEEINAASAVDIAGSLAPNGAHIHPVRLYRALVALPLEHYDLLKAVSLSSSIELPMGLLVLEDSRRDLINTLPLQLVVMILEALLQPKRKRIAELANFEAGAVAEAINKASKILLVTGAGISTSCGIPDFRSPGGVYSIVGEEYPELVDTPQKIFSIDYFRKNVKPFFEFNTKMVQGLVSGTYKPSVCHKFIAELEKKGKLLRQYTQNIDTLEKYAGVTKFIACHGSFETVSCTRSGVCGTALKDASLAEAALTKGEIPRCPVCLENPPTSLNVAVPEGGEPNVCDLYDKGVLKHDIVMFGESLPKKFFDHIGNDCEEADLIIVIGTSLQVGPVNRIIDSVDAKVPQILINREVVAPGHAFDAELLGDCDAVVQALLTQLKWDIDGSDTLDPANASFTKSKDESIQHRWIFKNGVDEDAKTASHGHGHSHGGQPCHGHGHSHGAAPEHGHGDGAAPAHGHSHGGQPCHGHGHGDAESTSQADVQEAPAPAQAHGHSHGGVPCHGHGHAHGEQ